MSLLCPKCLQAGRTTSRGGQIKLAKGRYCVVCGYHHTPSGVKKEGLRLRARNAAATRKDMGGLHDDELFG